MINNDFFGFSQVELRSYSLPLDEVPYDTSNCKSWENVTLEDVGETICIEGIAKETEYNTYSDFLFIWFSEEKTGLSLTTQGHILEGITGECVVTTGPVYYDNGFIMMKAGLDNLYQCETGTEKKPTITPNSVYYDAIPIEAPFDTTDCLEYNQITHDDIGSVLCVTGVVKASSHDEYDISYLFFNQATCDEFYVSVQRTYPGIMEGACIVAIGEVVQHTSGAPFLFVYPNQFFMCKNQ